jgi:hypothetical protein
MDVFKKKVEKLVILKAVVQLTDERVVTHALNRFFLFDMRDLVESGYASLAYLL